MFYFSELKAPFIKRFSKKKFFLLRPVKLKRGLSPYPVVRVLGAEGENQQGGPKYFYF
jgi:hypothetical protein